MRPLIVVVVGAVLAQASPVFAWKPVTHVHLAQEAWEDAKDGTVTLHRVNYETGEIGASLGEFRVSPALLSAIRDYPASYLAGVLGPDAYPDMVTGQMRVHPPGRGASTDPDLNENGPGTPPWLKKLWTLAFSRDGSPQVRAFVAGYLAHAAGDVYAHTYVNGYTGGIFDMTTRNGLQHVILEGYLEQRTPPLRPIIDRRTTIRDPYRAVEQVGISGGVDAFIAKHTAEIRCPTCAREEARLMSLPWNFVQLRNWMGDALRKYEALERELRANLDFWTEILADAQARLDWSCDLTRTAACPADGGTSDRCPGYDDQRANPFWCVAHAATVATLTIAGGPLEIALAPWRTLTTTVGPLMSRVRGWQRNIDNGLIRWVQTNHRVAIAMFYNRRGMDVEAALDEIKAFTPIATAMLVGFDVATIEQIQRTLRLATAPVREIQEQLDALRAELFEKAFLALFGVSPAELEQKYLTSHAFVDPMFGAGTLHALDRSMKLPASADDDFVRREPITRFDWRRFPAAYNTVTLIKLSLLTPSELNRLYRALAAVPPAAPLPSRMHHAWPLPPDNVMLDWGHTIDGSNQWVLGMPLADHGCVLYKRLFQRIHPGPRVRARGAQHPAEPTDNCTATGLPLLAVDKPFGVVAPRGRFTLNVSEDAVVESSAGTVTGCKKAPGKPCVATIVAPETADELDVVVTVRPKIPDPRRPPIEVHLQVQPKLAIEIAESSDVSPHALRPGQRVLLEVAPSVPVTWTLDGPGQLIDPARTVKKPPSIAATERAIDTKRLAHAKCRAIACKLRARNEIEKLTARVLVAEHATALADRAVTRRIYVAPAAGSAKSRATIRVRAADGRTAAIELGLRRAPIPLRLKNAKPSVKAGQLVQLEVTPPVPMAWSIARGGIGQIGELGSAKRKQLEQTLAPLQLKLRGLPAPSRPMPTPAPGPVPRPPPTTKPRKLEVERIVREDIAKQASSINELVKLGGTYRAPAKVAKPTFVVVTGIAQDGTGRTLTARIRVTP